MYIYLQAISVGNSTIFTHLIKTDRQDLNHETFYGGRDTCAGDSGAPLWKWLKNETIAVQIGITSRGMGCARYLHSTH